MSEEQTFQVIIGIISIVVLVGATVRMMLAVKDRSFNCLIFMFSPCVIMFYVLFFCWIKNDGTFWNNIGMGVLGAVMYGMPLMLITTPIGLLFLKQETRSKEKRYLPPNLNQFTNEEEFLKLTKERE